MNYLNLNYIKSHADEMNWNSFSRYGDFKLIDGSFFDRFSENINWRIASYYQSMTSEFIIRHECDLVDHWGILSDTQILLEETIERYKHFVHWDRVCTLQRVSESFLEKYSDMVYWPEALANQRVSYEFVLKHKHKVNWEWVFDDDVDPIFLTESDFNLKKKYPKFNPIIK